jgi:geranylgeranyl diphosphate synthase, type I
MLQQHEASRLVPTSVDGRTDPYGPIRFAVDTLLERFVDDRMAELAAVDPALVGIATHLRTLVAGGKRLRPAFVYWGFRAGGRSDDPLVVPVAAAVEMLHAFALLHDDVMDHARRRRGRPSAQQVFAGVHRRDGLGGDADWFGVSTAILAGDLAFVWADQLLDAAPLPPGALRGVRERYAALRTEVMTGQYLDLRLDRRSSVTEDEARRVALLKSGRYTVTRPLELGLALAGDTFAAGALREYGDLLGLAFQMRDDVLGLFGDGDRTGKDFADDLRAGKRTVLVLRALALGSPVERALLEHHLDARVVSDRDAARCCEVIAGCGALASVEGFIDALHHRAIDALDELPEPARSALRALADDLARRDR